MLLAAYADIFGPSTVIISGRPPEITEEFTLSVYPQPLSLRGTNSTFK